MSDDSLNGRVGSIQFVVAPWMFGEGPPDDPFPCRHGVECEDRECNHLLQEWFGRMQQRFGDNAPDAWDPGLPPGGYVCAACGAPTESEPCPDHQLHPSKKVMR